MGFDLSYIYSPFKQVPEAMESKQRNKHDSKDLIAAVNQTRIGHCMHNVFSTMCECFMSENQDN